MRDLEWLKEEVGKNTLVDAADFDRFPNELVGHVEIKTLYELIDQVEQPALPVIPEFVAEWIKTIREKNGDMIGSLVFGNYNGKVGDWLFLDDETMNVFNAEKLMSAWKYGYRVEEEKYEVVDADGINVLGKVEFITEFQDYKVGDVISVGRFGLGTKWNTKLTEQEIKDYDERYWAFAKEVTNENN